MHTSGLLSLCPFPVTTSTGGGCACTELCCPLSSVLFLVPQVPRAKALFSYRGHNPGELRFNKGDVIVLLRQLDQNWYLGELNGVSGVFPASSVQVFKQLPLPPPLCRALYNFDLRSRDKSENNDCLSFHKVTPPCRGWAVRAGPAPFFRLHCIAFCCLAAP